MYPINFRGEMVLFLMMYVYFMKKRLELYEFKAYNEILGSFWIFIHECRGNGVHTNFLFIFLSAL